MMSNIWRTHWRRIVVAIFVLGGLVGLALFWGQRLTPIRIGFAAQMTGKQAELGVQERNGVLLAIERINASGGIAGRKVELLAKDDQGVPEMAQAVDQELIKAGVVAIIGHATSGQTVAGLKITNPGQIVMIGPTVSTPALSGLDDYFFRVYPTFKDSSQAFAKYIYQAAGLKKIAIIYDVDNAAYSETYNRTFSEKYISLGGTVANEISFSSTAHPDFPALLSVIDSKHLDGILIIASDIDTALIAQKIRIQGWTIPLFTSAWAQTETLINNGGAAVEGMKLEQSYALTSQSPGFIKFKVDFQKRFGISPSFGAAFGYDAAMVLAKALEKTDGKANGLRKSLLETGKFKGLVDDFSIDPYGDVRRPFYLTSIENGKFIIIGKLN